MNAVHSNTINLRGRWLWTAWLLLLALWTVGLLTPFPVQVKEEVLPESAGYPVSKLVHFGVYAILAGCTTFLPPCGRRWLPLLALSVHACSTEFAQKYVVLRDGNLTDVAINHAGLVLGLIVTLKWWLAGR